jgi:dipeptidyl aminopeptidase/acylaminoacyl peptidase
MSADGSAPTNLTGDSAENDLGPSFSPDGTRIAFVRRDGGDQDVFVMDADGSAQTNLTSDSLATDEDPIFSPDGTQIAFASERDGFNDVFVMDADGSAPINLTSDSPATNEDPDWQRLRASLALTIDTSKNKVRRKKRVFLSGQIDAPHNEAGCESAQTVELQRRKRSQSDAEFATFAQLQSDATGSFAAKVKVKKTSTAPWWPRPRSVRTGSRTPRK